MDPLAVLSVSSEERRKRRAEARGLDGTVGGVLEGAREEAEEAKTRERRDSAPR
jgi:hypothetical protein